MALTLVETREANHSAETADTLSFGPVPELRVILAQADVLNDDLQALAHTGELFKGPHRGKRLISGCVSPHAVDLMEQAPTQARGLAFLTSKIDDDYQKAPARVLENKIFCDWSDGPETDVRKKRAPASERQAIVEYLAHAINDPVGLMLHASLDSEWDEARQSEVLLYEPGSTKWRKSDKVETFLQGMLVKIFSENGVRSAPERPDLLLAFAATPRGGKVVSEALKSERYFQAFVLNALDFFLWNHQHSSIDLGQVLCCNPTLFPAWEHYLQCRLKQSAQPAVLLEQYQDLWRHNPRGWEALLAKVFPESTEPVSGEVITFAQRLGEASTPMAKLEDINFGPKSYGRFSVARGCVRLEMDDWPDGFFLHLIVRGKDDSKSLRTTECTVIESPAALKEAVIPEPNGLELELSGFFCDQEDPFKDQRAWGAIATDHWCKLESLTPHLDTINESGDTLALLFLEIQNRPETQSQFIRSCVTQPVYHEAESILQFTVGNIGDFLQDHELFDEGTQALLVRRWEGVTLYVNQARKLCYRKDDTPRPTPVSDELYQSLAELLGSHWQEALWPVITRARAAERKLAGIDTYWKQKGDLAKMLKEAQRQFSRFSLTQWKDLEAGANPQEAANLAFLWEKNWSHLEQLYPEVTTLRRDLQRAGIPNKIMPDGSIYFAFNIKGVGINGLETDPEGTIHAQVSFARSAQRPQVQIMPRPQEKKKTRNEVSNPAWLREAQTMGEHIFMAMVAPASPNKHAPELDAAKNADKLTDWKDKARHFRATESAKQRKALAQTHPVHKLLYKHWQQKRGETEIDGELIGFRTARFEETGRLVQFRNPTSLDELETDERLVVQDFKIDFRHSAKFKLPKTRLEKPFCREDLGRHEVNADAPDPFTPNSLSSA